MTALEARFWARVQKSDSCSSDGAVGTMSSALRHPDLDHKWLAVHLWNSEPRSALHNTVQRSPWRERIPALLVGFGGGIAAAIGLYGWVTWVTR